MTFVAAPPHLTDTAFADWDVLQAETPDPPLFDPAVTDRLPEPARAWILHAISPGTPLRKAVVLHTHGRIRLGQWRDFTADQVLAPLRGFVWAADAYLGILPVHGFDRYHDGVGEMRWRVLDLLPVMSGTGPDVTRSAADRLACEFVMAPAAALDPSITWKAPDDRTALACLGGREITLSIGPGGELRRVSMRRWGNPGGRPYTTHDFTVECRAEDTFDGFTIPTDLRGAWDGQDFITFTVDDAIFR
ncbi:DUF6544 family protein [Nonomuraea sediminis]|uniref:DUF6544 family protein n=1 Tax=Nonomuraea sediminis TaxID=2835864 RepID=UPI001BDCA868|nr:DUF6544 family protein [Nonomuraea sediminis]